MGSEMNRYTLIITAVLVSIMFSVTPPLLTYCAVMAGDKEEHQFHSCWNNNTEESVAAFRRFAEKHPDSEFADDAYLEIAEIQRSLGQIAEARNTLEEIGKKYPKADKHRYIYLGEIRKEWLKGWKAYIAENPVRTADYADLKLAELYMREKKYETASEILKSLIARIKKPVLPANPSRAVLKSPDLRKESLFLALKVAKLSEDTRQAENISSVIVREYGPDVIPPP